MRFYIFQRFVCRLPTCRFLCDFAPDLLDHERDEHSGTLFAYKCPHCDRTFDNLEDVGVHQHREHAFKMGKHTPKYSEKDDGDRLVGGDFTSFSEFSHSFSECSHNLKLRIGGNTRVGSSDLKMGKHSVKKDGDRLVG